MKKIMYRAVFNRKKQLRADGKGLIQIEAYLERRRMYVSTHIYIYPSQWDDAKREICHHPHAEELNWMIAERMTELEGKEIALWKSGRNISLRGLREEVKNGIAPQFLPFMASEIEKGRIRESTRENRYTTYFLLKEYCEELTIGELTPYFVSKFESWMCTKGYHTNTIAKHLSHLRIYVNAAIQRGVMSEEDNPFHKRRISHRPFTHTHLTPFELEKLERLTVSPKQQHLRHALDAFLFCCYTGLRYSDFVRLTTANIQRGTTHTWINTESQKTGASISLPIDLLFEGKALALLNRYSDNMDAFFHLPSNSTVDKRLQSIAQHAGIRKHFSFHSARHTNATLLLMQGVNVTTVQRLLGHKNVKTTMNYCEVINQTIIKELKKCRKR
ncbi:MAG: site-specific integrase [Bacteroidaceae bacterium]|nr:site-specific integrase [Bacteroidaceae bacterium]